MSDTVRDFLVKRGCPDFVVAGGLERLVATWERVVESVCAGEEQYEDDYLNDMDGREILAAALAVAPRHERATFLARVEGADSRIRSCLLPTTECLWGAENARKYGYDRERSWWYFYRPQTVDRSWRTF